MSQHRSSLITVQKSPAAGQEMSYFYRTRKFITFLSKARSWVYAESH